jgi:hypothetical protein
LTIQLTSEEEVAKKRGIRGREGKGRQRPAIRLDVGKSISRIDQRVGRNTDR